MNNRFRHGLRYIPPVPRTLDAAFRTPRYAAPIERPWPPLWKRALRAIWRLL